MLRVISDYLRAIEAKDSDRVRAALHPEVAQHEYPNQLVKDGASRTREVMLEGLAKGSKVLTRESYELEDALVEGDRVACRIRWRGTLVPATAIEFRLLALLIERLGELVPHAELLAAGWPMENDPDPLWLKPHLARVRDKLRTIGAPMPTAVRAVGYRLDA